MQCMAAVVSSSSPTSSPSSSSSKGVPVYTFIRSVARQWKLGMHVAAIGIAACHQLGYYTTSDVLLHIKRYPPPLPGSGKSKRNDGIELLLAEARRYVASKSSPSLSSPIPSSSSSSAAASKADEKESKQSVSGISSSGGTVASASMTDVALLFDHMYTQLAYELAGYVTYNGRDAWTRCGPWQDDTGGGARDIFFEIEFRVPVAGQSGRTSPARGGDLLVHLGTTRLNEQWHTTLIEVLNDGAVWGRVWPVPAFQIGNAKAGEWHTVQLYYNDRTKITTGWIDGKKSATDQAGNKDTTSNNTAYYCIGPSDTTHMRVNAFYDGDVRRVRIWTRLQTSGWHPSTALSGTGNLLVDLRPDMESKGFRNVVKPQLAAGAPQPAALWNHTSVNVLTDITTTDVTTAVSSTKPTVKGLGDDEDEETKTTTVTKTRSDDDGNWSMASHMASLVDRKDFSDITLILSSDNGRRLYGHRLVLIRSSFFRAMLLGGLKESHEREVTLDDISYGDMKAILRYLYTDSLDIPLISPEETLRLYSLADRFQLNNLAHRYAVAFGETLDIDNAEQCLLLTSSPSCAVIRAVVLEFIRVNYETVWQVSSCFEQIAQHDPLLLRDVLRYCTGPATITATTAPATA